MGPLCRHLQGWWVWLRVPCSRWALGAAGSIPGQVQDLGGGSRVSRGLLSDPGTWEAACIHLA